jgi:hypothetical protein
MPKWEDFETALRRVCLALRLDADGNMVEQLPPPIDPELIAEATPWLKEWLNGYMTGPKPGGRIQAAAYAMVWCATSTAATMVARQEPPLSDDLPDGTYLEVLIFASWPQHETMLWAKHWPMAYQLRPQA